ncbi:MAG: hypothetical protein ACI9F9_000160 [Candidatus Paceibacteria bacterium]|jgi:hypothetical protein
MLSLQLQSALLCVGGLLCPGEVAFAQEAQAPATEETPAAAVAPGTAVEEEPIEEVVLRAEMDTQQGREALQRAIGFLLRTQNADGSWATDVCDDLNGLGFAPDSYFAWQQASTALALLAVAHAPRTTETDFALRHGVQWLAGSRMPHRGSIWDVDSTWASLYGFSALVELAQDDRLSAPEVAEPMRRRAMEFYADLEKRQTQDGGWAYYDDPPYTTRPTWATSFCTALVLPALLDAKALDWPVDPTLAVRAQALVERCALPNGAYTYNFNLRPRPFGGESINQVPGSTGRIQVCHWALARAGLERITPDLLAEGLGQFFEYHAYLDMARRRPIPHEGWFANAGYFYFFGHYYAARVIELLPLDQRERWSRRLRYHIAKTLTDEGSCSDFMSTSYEITASTAFAALVLALGLPEIRAVEASQ